MSTTLMVVLEGIGPAQYPADLDPKNPGCDYGNLIPGVARSLETLAEQLGVTPISSFHYADPDMLRETMEFLEGERKEKIQKVLKTQKEWHDPADGLATIDALINYLQELQPEEARRAHPEFLFGSSVDPLLWDLRAVRSVLASINSRFHFEAM